MLNLCIWVTLTVLTMVCTTDWLSVGVGRGSDESTSSISRAVAKLSVRPLSVQGCRAICSRVSRFSGDTTNWPFSNCSHSEMLLKHVNNCFAFSKIQMLSLFPFTNSYSRFLKLKKKGSIVHGAHALAHGMGQS